MWLACLYLTPKYCLLFFHQGLSEELGDPRKACSQIPCTGPSSVRALPPPIQLHPLLGRGRLPPRTVSLRLLVLLLPKWGGGVKGAPAGLEGRRRESRGPSSCPLLLPAAMLLFHGGSPPGEMHSSALFLTFSRPSGAEIRVSSGV